MSLQYHVDGRLVPAEEATVSVEDRGFQYGDAAFETLRAYGGEVFEWPSHVDRLERSLETLGFARAMPPKDDLLDRIDETLAANDLEDAYVKLSISRGVQPGKLTPDERVDPTIVVVVKPLPRGGTEGEAVWDEPATVSTAETRTVPDAALPADAKTHNYLNGILARLELRRAAGDSAADAADEALMLDGEGHVCEGASSNVCFVDGGVLKTPTTNLSLLPGVTRSVVLDLASGEGFPIEQGRYSLADLRGADEVFLTNSTWEIRPVRAIDGLEFDVGPMTKLLRRLYDERVENRYY
ncbi:aminotransferase class IV [Halobacteriales archaeon Cl-PHB]